MDDTDTVQQEYLDGGERDGGERDGGGVATTVVTRPKSTGVRNELWFVVGNKEVGIKGWQCCAVETLGAGLMIAGLFFVALHGKDVANSVTSMVSKSISK